MLWWVFILVGAILLLRGHRMIKIVGALIGALAGLIATDFLFQAMPTLLEYENEVKIGLVIFGAILMHSMLLVAMRSVAGLGVFVAFSSLVLALQEEGYVVEQNHSNLVGIGLAVGSFILTWNMRRAMPLIASLIIGASLITSGIQMYSGVTIQQLDVIRPSPMWLWILLFVFGLLIQRIDIKKRKHLKDVKEGVVFDPKLSPSHTPKKKEKGLNRYVQKEAWHSDI